MLPLFVASFDKLNGQLSSLKERFCEYLADIAINSSIDQGPDGFLFRFLLTIDIEGRVFIAKHIEYFLHKMDNGAIDVVWNRWLHEYLESRLEGVPRALDVEEVKEMIKWVSAFETEFPDVVRLICQMPVPSVEDTTIYWRIYEKKLAKQYPDDLARLLVYLLPATKEPFYALNIVVNIVKDLITAQADETCLKYIIDQLAVLGLESAAELRNTIIPGKQIWDTYQCVI
ncbi:hypothetical protein SDC9_59479 [bioreactor metagenome]|uniref:Uncharacterized protein n=1 Tax=bioreactor metagenome TaxID=1076179 RepID=A0A644XG75_9ZZZZ|nr:DUF4020 domain-containing protein [Dysgonamonadaceae bacterium]